MYMYVYLHTDTYHKYTYLSSISRYVTFAQIRT